MKRRIISLLLMLLLAGGTMAQHPAKYWVQFKDKAGSPYSVTRPAELLSPRALELRQRYHIPVDELDIPVNESYIRQVLALDDSMRLLTRSKWLNGITVYSEREDILPRISALPFVAFAERTIAMQSAETCLDTVFLFMDAARPSAVSNPPLWVQGDDYDYGKGDLQVRMNNIHWLHRLGLRGEGVQMMVMDAGFLHVDTLHFFSALRNDHRLLGARNFVQPGKSPFTTGSHGTNVLSCIAAWSEGELVGTAPMAMFYLCQTEDGRTEHKVEEDNWVAGLEWADSLGCQVLNSSLGYTKFDDTTQVRTRDSLTGQVSRASRAATIAASKGMLVCNSAGNEGGGKWNYIGCPADAEGILSVGAVNTRGQKAMFSSVGPTADGRIKPDVAAMGLGCYVGGINGTVNPSAGTSFSSPLMAGMVACLWQAFPSKSNYEIMEAVRISGSQALHPDTALGYGIPDFLKAYNYLLQPQPRSYSIEFDAFDTQNDTLFFHVETKDGKPFDFNRLSVQGVTLGPPSFSKIIVIEKQTIKRTIDLAEMEILQDTTTSYKLVLPRLKNKTPYLLTKLEIEYNGEKLHYIVGQEKLPKKKK